MEDYYLCRGRPLHVCKFCKREDVRAYAKANPNKVRETQRRLHLRRTYGLSVDQYDAMVRAQGGLCLICNRPPPGKLPLVVDHCHDTGRIRGLLCNTCNNLMGMWGDDPLVLEAAAQYLRSHDLDSPPA